MALALSLPGAEPSAGQLFKEGRKAERAGDVVRAYLLYSEAAAKDPGQRKYWNHSEALRTQAALKALPMPKLSREEISPPEPAPAVAGVATTITADDLAEVSRLRPPPELKALPGRKNLDLRGDAKSVFTQAARAFGLDTIFDGDYQAGPALHLRLDDAGYRQALHALEAATGSFVVPLGEHLFLVVKDTPAKRAEAEPTVAIAIPIPDPVSVQEAQELARSIQQAMEIQKLAVDPDRHMVLIKDRISKVRPAQVLFEQLAHGRAQVAVEVQFLEVDKTSLLRYGLLLPNSIPLMYLGSGGTGIAAQALSQFLFGRPMFGLGIGNANLFATKSRSLGTNLLKAEVRSLDGAAATLHIGDKYPIATATFLGATTAIPPTFNFEDLGLLLKVTPHVHGVDEVSLDVNAEFKVLGNGSSNGIPVISTRKLESKVRLRMGEWALVAGLMSTNEARAISGVAGLSSVPGLGRLLRQNDLNSQSTEVVILLKPSLLNVPAGEFVTRSLCVGTEGRLKIPL